MTKRMDEKFAALKAEGRPAFVTYFMAGDPDYDTAIEIMKRLPGIREPFSCGAVGGELPRGVERLHPRQVADGVGVFRVRQPA